MSAPYERLKEQRVALGLSQEAFASLGGVTKRSQVNYENGKRKPDSAYFALIAKAGVDVDYVLTGTPKMLRDALNNVRVATELAQTLGGSEQEVLNAQARIHQSLSDIQARSGYEEELLKHVRRCNDADREVLLQMAQRFAGDAPAPTTRKGRSKT